MMKVYGLILFYCLMAAGFGWAMLKANENA